MDEGPNNLCVHVTDSALMHPLMAGMESFKVRRWGEKETTNRGPVETTGFLWGYVPEGKRAASEVLERGNVLKWQLEDFRYWLTA